MTSSFLFPAHRYTLLASVLNANVCCGFEEAPVTDGTSSKVGATIAKIKFTDQTWIQSLIVSADPPQYQKIQLCDGKQPKNVITIVITMKCYGKDESSNDRKMDIALIAKCSK